MTAHSRLTRSAAAALAALTLAACGPGAGTPLTTAGEKEFGDAVQALTSNNGMSVNGMSVNGMSVNGMSVNGLTSAALTTKEFKNWFNLLPPLNDVVMKYVVLCAAPSGSTYSFYSSTAKKTYTWYGNLGVAPGWVSGHAITSAEEQLVSACLAAHVNKFLLQIPIAIEGKAANGTSLPVLSGELAGYDVRESCFFGNLFNGDGIYAGIDHADWGSRWSSPRACAFAYASIGTDQDCPPIRIAGVCSQICTPAADGLSYDSCSYGGKTFKALATRIASTSRSYCGDGRCDPQERCGSGTSWNSCAPDCGTCQ